MGSGARSGLRPLNLLTQCGPARPLREELGGLSAAEVQALKPAARAVRDLLFAAADDRWPLVVAAVAALRGADAGARAKRLFKLAVLASDEAVAAELVDAGALPELAAALASEPSSEEGMVCCQYAACALAALAQHAQCAQPLLRGGALGAALCGLEHGVAACTAGSAEPAERASQLLGIAYGCACAVASLACWPRTLAPPHADPPTGGAADTQADEFTALAPALSALLVPGSARLIVPTCRWLVLGERTHTRAARIGGGAARCVLNLALRHAPMRRALREAGALAALAALADDPCQSDALRAVSVDAAAALRSDAPPAPALPAPSRAAPSHAAPASGGAAGGERGSAGLLALERALGKAHGGSGDGHGGFADGGVHEGEAAAEAAADGTEGDGAAAAAAHGARKRHRGEEGSEGRRSGGGQRRALKRREAARGGSAAFERTGARQRQRQLGCAARRASRLAASAVGLGAVRCLQTALREAQLALAIAAAVEPAAARAAASGGCETGCAWGASVGARLASVLAALQQLAQLVAHARAAAEEASATAARAAAAAGAQAGGEAQRPPPLFARVAAAQATEAGAGAGAGASADAAAAGPPAWGAGAPAAPANSPAAAAAAAGGGGRGGGGRGGGGRCAVRRHGAWQIAAIVGHRLIPHDGSQGGGGDGGRMDSAAATQPQPAFAANGGGAQPSALSPQRQQFLVRWAGRGAPADSWEDCEAIDEPAAVAAFLWGPHVAASAAAWVWRALHLTHPRAEAPGTAVAAVCKQGKGRAPRGKAAPSGAQPAAAPPQPAAAVAWVPVPLPRVADSLAELLLLADGPEQPSAAALPAGWPAGVRFQPALEWSGGQRGECLRAELSRPMAAPLVAVRPLPPSHPAAIALAEAREERRQELRRQQQHAAAAARGAGGAAAPAADPAAATTADSAAVAGGGASAGGGESDAVAYGLFACCALPAGLWVCDYGGTVKRQKRSDRSCYLMELAAEPERELFLDVDAALAGSEARMINDFTGLAAEPNVVAKVCHCPSTGDLRIAVLTTRRIEAGGELLLDYGVGFLADWKVDAMADDGCSSNDDGCCGSDDE